MVQTKILEAVEKEGKDGKFFATVTDKGAFKVFYFGAFLLKDHSSPTHPFTHPPTTTTAS
jgi:hypothetical protein